MTIEDTPEGPPRFLLSASEDGLAALGKKHTGISLRAAVSRELMSRWWPIPGRSSRGLAKVPEGALGLVYVGEPVRQTIARVVFGAGPAVRDEGEAQFGYPLREVDPLVPAAPYPKARPHQSRGAERLSREQFETALAAVYGLQPWQPESIPLAFVPVIHRRVRYVQVSTSTWIRWRSDSRWPTVDGDGRVRFDRWRRPSGGEALQGLGASHESTGNVEALDEFRLAFDTSTGEVVSGSAFPVTELPDGHEHERIFAVDSGGRETEVTDDALALSRLSYEAGIAGVLSDEDLAHLPPGDD